MQFDNGELRFLSVSDCSLPVFGLINHSPVKLGTQQEVEKCLTGKLCGFRIAKSND